MVKAVLVVQGAVLVVCVGVVVMEVGGKSRSRYRIGGG